MKPQWRKKGEGGEEANNKHGTRQVSRPVGGLEVTTVELQFGIRCVGIRFLGIHPVAHQLGKRVLG